MSLVWFTPRKVAGPVDDAIEGLRKLGVTFEASHRAAIYQLENDCGHDVLMKSIGWVEVYDDRAVTCIFRDQITESDIRVMLGSTERAVLGDDVPRNGEGWNRYTKDGRRRWSSIVQARANPEHDETAARILKDVALGTSERIEAVSLLVERAMAAEAEL